MIWQNGWAFVGLFALVLPVLIHLLSRKRAAIQKFPSLRFLDVSRLLPTRSPRLSDVPLLLVRLAIFVAAVLALAEPLWLSAARKRAFNSTVARAIVLDSSVSMMRKGASGQSAMAAARIASENLAHEAQASMVIQTSSPNASLIGAVAWLGTQDGRGEVVVLSDFQTSSVDSAALSAIPKQIGVHLVRSVFASDVSNQGPTFATSAARVQVSTDSARTNAEWSTLPDSNLNIPSIWLFASSTQRADAELMAKAAIKSSAVQNADSTKPVAIVFGDAAERASFVRDAKAPTESWMADAIAGVSSHELLGNAARSASAFADTNIATPFVVVARTQSGAALAYAAQTTVNGKACLAFFTRSAPTSFASAALVTAIAHSVALQFPVAESDASTLSDATLKLFERGPADVAPTRSNANAPGSGASDGRWFWAVVIALLILETFMRRRSTVERTSNARRTHVERTMNAR